MANENKLPMPKLPYREGSLIWDPDVEDRIQYRKIVQLAPGIKRRLCVCGYSILECLERMDEKVTILREKLGIAADGTNVYMGMTLGEGVRKYLLEFKAKSIKTSTLDRHLATLDNQIGRYDIAKKIVGSITEEDLQQHLNIIFDKYSTSVTLKTKDVLSMFFCFVYRKNKDDNPMNGVIVPGTKIQRMAKTKQIMPEDIMSDEQIKAFRKWIDNGDHDYTSGPYRYAYLYCFLIDSYLRIGEAQALTWKDIDFDKRLVRITKNYTHECDRSDGAKKKMKYVMTEPKNQRSVRTVKLTKAAIWALKKQRGHIDYKDTDPIFMTQNGIVAREANLLRNLRKILDDAGLAFPNGFDLHRLRHTGISRCIRRGVPIQIVSEQAGHDVSVTQHTYYHIIAEEHDEYLKIMDDEDF